MVDKNIFGKYMTELTPELRKCKNMQDGGKAFEVCR